MDQFYLKEDMTKIYCKVWEVPNPKAMIQIAHGMSEHIGRYDSFAKFMNKHGILVYGNNHRGHGPYSNETLGYFGEQNGWNNVLDDMNTVNQLMTEKYPTLPKFILGHSMGSFLVRYFINQYGDEFNGAILVGTAFGGGIREKSTLPLVKFNKLLHGPEYKSKFINYLFNKTLSSQVKNAETHLDWVNSSADEVQIYMKDPYCGFDMTDQFYIDLLSALIHINDDENVKNISQLPILILAGAEDPVGNSGKDVLKLNDFYQQQHLDSNVFLYPGMRHEILREKDHETVYRDILHFIQNQLNK